MLVSDFDYNLPESFIAQKPLPRRDQSRMMVLHRQTGEIIHSQFQKLSGYLSKRDVLVVNNTKVIPAKAWGKKEGKDIEFLFIREREKKTWEVLCRPAKKVKHGDILSFSPKLKGKVVGVDPEGKRIIHFPSGNVLSELNKIGLAPLPPYIKRNKSDKNQREMDLKKYQTCFAQKKGSIAAPTAGLHFTPEILKKIKDKGIHIVQVTLDVGLSTFQPVRVKHVEKHLILEEFYSINKNASQTITKAKNESRSVVAIGTTSVRALESSLKKGKIQPGTHSTSLFIYPGYEFKVIDKLLTNFHLPQSTLLMLVSAFAGVDFIKRAYKEAVEREYRFYSYGDCMLII